MEENREGIKILPIPVKNAESWQDGLSRPPTDKRRPGKAVLRIRKRKK
jgi:hypothetical protein